MKKLKSKSNKNAGPRVRVKKRMPKSAESIDDRSPIEMKKVLHELQVHQVELETQNEQLRQAQIEATEARKKSTDLYDFAPVGYFTFDKKGHIVETNVTGASLLGSEKRSLTGQPFHRFVTPQHFSIFQSHLQMVLEIQSKQICKLKLTRKDGSLFDALVETVIMTDRKGKKIDHYMSCVSDITEIVKKEEALRRSEERFRQLADSTFEGLLIHDKGIILDVNQALTRLTGYDYEEAIGQNVFTFIARESKGDVLQRLQNPSAATFKIALMKKDGTTCLVEGAARDITYQGKTARVVAFRDITERKRADEALRESEQRYRHIVEDSTEFVCRGNADGTLTFINEALCRYMGMSREELLGRNVAEFIPDVDRKALFTFLRSLTARKQTEDIEQRVLMPSGDIRWHLWTVSAVYDKGGRFIEFQGTGRDVTERKRAESELDKTRDMLSEGQKIAHVGTFEYIVDTKATIWSEEQYRIHGLDPSGPSPAYDILLAENIHPDDAALLHQTFTAAMQSSSIFELEHRIVRPDGSVRWVQDRAHPRFDQNGKLVRYIGATLDITERKQAEESLRTHAARLEAANKELESFSYSVSHDLRAPLRAIDGYARMLLKKHGHEFDEDSMRKFNVIRSSAHMMGQLIDDLLTLSRLGRKEISMSKIDMGVLIADVWKELQADTPDRKINLTVNRMPSGYGDRALIKQVYMNLLSNAVKFTKFRDTALIEVGGHVDGNDDVYYVKDNGVGFDMAYYDKLFGVFQRLHKADEFEGTGIGLATVQRMINRHGGRVWAEGKVDEGATFYFSLPPPQTH
ncbi:MAG: PAS domain S-box protein [Syntrophales bacterium]